MAKQHSFKIDLTQVHRAGGSIDIFSITTRKAMRHFIERVKDGKVFGELTAGPITPREVDPASTQSLADFLAVRTNNICLQVRSATYHQPSGMLTGFVELYGPDKEEASVALGESETIPLSLRIITQPGVMGIVIQHLVTLDYIPRK